MCTLYWWSFSTVSWFLLLLYIEVVFSACMCLCVCVWTFAWFQIKIDWLIVFVKRWIDFHSYTLVVKYISPAKVHHFVISVCLELSHNFLSFYAVSQKSNGITQNKDQLRWYLAEIFKRLAYGVCVLYFSCRFAYHMVFQTAYTENANFDTIKQMRQLWRRSVEKTSSQAVARIGDRTAKNCRGHDTIEEINVDSKAEYTA